jgi:small subunit ribosomal protein S9
MEKINTIGRRKTSVARIYMSPGKGQISVNGRKFDEYFPSVFLQNDVLKPLRVTESVDKFDIQCNVDGGGVSGQAGALQLAISRALLKLDYDTYHDDLKGDSLLTRDPRMVERKKYGRKKARKRFQFSKR